MEATSQAALELYTSVTGSDGNRGTQDEPPATLAGARNRVRSLKKEHSDRDIIIWIGGGTYYLGEMAVFGLDDSATPHQTITYAAVPAQTPVFSSSVPIKHWQKLAQTPSDLPNATIRPDLHCQQSHVTGNLPEHVRGVGMLLAGCGPGTKDVHRENEVMDNHYPPCCERTSGTRWVFSSGRADLTASPIACSITVFPAYWSIDGGTNSETGCKWTATDA